MASLTWQIAAKENQLEKVQDELAQVMPVGMRGAQVMTQLEDIAPVHYSLPCCLNFHVPVSQPESLPSDWCAALMPDHVACGSASGISCVPRHERGYDNAHPVPE